MVRREQLYGLVFHLQFQIIIVSMGQSVSSTSDRATLLSNYDELDAKCEYGTIICHKVTKETYLLKQLNFPDHNEYKKALKLFEIKREKVRENVLNLVQLENQSKSLFCSEIYRLSLVYQFAQITLAEEIEARQPESRYFEQQDLWSIIQSCLYGFVQVSQNMVLQPNRVHIMSDGLVKIVDPDMVSNNSWYMLDENMYYAPQRFRNFTNSNKINTNQQEAMFSLGATLLNAAILESCFDCYEYGSHRFNERKLSEKLQRLQRLYSEDFKTVICGLLEVNPETRMSMQELQEIVGKLANQEMEEHSQQQVAYAQKSRQQEPIQQKQQQPFREVGNYPSQQYYPRQPEISNPPPVIKFKNIEIKSLEPIIEYPRQNLKLLNNKLPNYREVESQNHSIHYSHNAGIQSLHFQSPPSYPIDNRLELVKSKNITQFDSRSHHFDSGMKDYASVYKTQREKDENLFTDPKLMEQIRKDISEITARRSLVPTNNTTKCPSGLSSQQGAFTPLYHSKSQLRPQFQPQPQTHYEEDGKIFEGVVINGMKQGFGKLSYPEGPFYVGTFVNDKMHGKGVLYYDQNKPAYDGQWQEDQFHGKGTLYNENPLEQNQPFDFNDFNLVEDFWTKYEGEFVNDNKQGFGKLFLSNGERFEGSFERDCINGEGVFLDAFGGKHEGRWDNNVLVERFSRH